MAIPTDFIICTPNATATKVTPMLGHGSMVTPNLVLMDIAGTVVPKTIVLEANMSIILSATFTDAQVKTALLRYLQELGYKADGSSGGNPVQSSKQIATTLSTCT